MRVFVLVLLFVIGGQALGQQKLYVTVDKNGVKHYSDQAAMGAHEIFIEMDEPATSVEQNSLDEGKESSDNEPMTKEDIDDLTKDWKKGKAPYEKIAPSYEDACKLSKYNINTLSDQSKQAVRYDENGQAQELSKEEREEALNMAQQNMARYCM